LTLDAGSESADGQEIAEEEDEQMLLAELQLLLFPAVARAAE
jgi:hypothetical protein